MRTMLDGQTLFDEQLLEIEAGSAERAVKERAVAGLDGVVSIDLGGRTRKIKQKGQLRAVSSQQMQERIEQISSLMDGKEHILKTNEGRVFTNVRMDKFKVSERNKSGGGIVVDYEIEYTQLKV
jgi:hypothetical protein